MQTKSELITPHIARTTLWHVGAPTSGQEYPPSEWRQLILKLIAKSDPSNRARLALGFPGEVAAMNLAQQTPGGIDVLRQIATTVEVM